MTDSESNQPVERRRADPLQVAADQLASDEVDGASAPKRESAEVNHPSPRHTPVDALSQAAASIEEDSSDEGDDDSPRARRAAARAARQAAADKRKAERAAAKAYAASKRHAVRNDGGGADDAPKEKTLAEKLDAAREAVSTPPDQVEAEVEAERTQTFDAVNDHAPAEEPAPEAPVAEQPGETTAVWPAVEDTPRSSPFSRLGSAPTAGQFSNDEEPSAPQPEAAELQPEVVEEPVVETIENEAPAAEPAPVEPEPEPSRLRSRSPSRSPSLSPLPSRSLPRSRPARRRRLPSRSRSRPRQPSPHRRRSPRSWRQPVRPRSSALPPHAPRQPA